MEFGNKIKQIRTRLNLTQEELANRCELTKSYISQLENDKTSPSLATLSLVLEVLGTNFHEFFKEESHEKFVFSKDEHIVKNFDEYDMTWLVPSSQRLDMEPILMELKPHGVSLEDRPHEGQEFGYVLEGVIEVIYGEQIKTCKTGEAFYFETDKFHYIRNKLNKKAKVIWVSCPPNF